MPVFKKKKNIEKYVYPHKSIYYLTSSRGRRCKHYAGKSILVSASGEKRTCKFDILLPNNSFCEYWSWERIVILATLFFISSNSILSFFFSLDIFITFLCSVTNSYPYFAGWKIWEFSKVAFKPLAFCPD